MQTKKGFIKHELTNINFIIPSKERFAAPEFVSPTWKTTENVSFLFCFRGFLLRPSLA